MSQNLKALIISLNEAKTNLESKAKKDWLTGYVSSLETAEKKGFGDVNWVSAKALEVVGVMPEELIQDKNKSFKTLCKKLKPTKINLQNIAPVSRSSMFGLSSESSKLKTDVKETRKPGQKK